jgi:hypothetical protein
MNHAGRLGRATTATILNLPESQLAGAGTMLSKLLGQQGRDAVPRGAVRHEELQQAFFL